MRYFGYMTFERVSLAAFPHWFGVLLLLLGHYRVHVHKYGSCRWALAIPPHLTRLDVCSKDVTIFLSHISMLVSLTSSCQ